jgi:WD40 repeat protein
MLTGARPFQGAVHLVLQQALRDDPPSPRRLDPRIPADLETICLKCLEKEPARRYASARELADDLGAFLEHRPIRARPASAVERAVKWAKRRPALAALAVVSGVALLALVGGAVALHYNGELIEARDRLAGSLAQEHELRQQVEWSGREIQRQRERSVQLADLALAAELWDVGKPDRLDRLRATLAKYRGRDDLVGFEWRYLDRLAGEVHRLPGHERQVSGVAFAPDGTRLASSSRDGSVRVWDATAGKQLVVIPDVVPAEVRERTAPAALVVFVGPERLVTAWEDGGLALRDARTGAAMWSEPGTGLRSLAASRDGKMLAVGYSDGTVRVLDAATGKERATLRDDSCGGYMLGVAFSPDGRLLAAAGDSGWLQVWDWARGASVWKPKMVGASLRAVAFSPDGRHLAAHRAVWDVDRQEAAFTLERSFTAAAFSPDGLRLAVNDGTDLLVYPVNVAPGRERTCWTFRGHARDIASLAFSPDGGRVATAAADGTVRLWNVLAPQQVRELEVWDGPVRIDAGHRHRPAFSPDGKCLAAPAPGDHKTLLVWDVVTEEIVSRLQSPEQTAEITCTAFSPDGRLLAAGSWDRVLLWEQGRVRYVLRKEQGVGALDRVSFSPDGRLLAAVDGAAVRVWDVTTGRVERDLALRSRWGRAAAFSGDGRLLAVGDSDTIRTWRVGTWEEAASFRGHAGPVHDVEFSSEGLLASASGDGTARTWDVRTGEARGTVRAEHGASAEGVSFSRDGRSVAGTDEEGAIQVWDAATGLVILRLSAEDRRAGSRAYAAVFSPAGDRLAASAAYAPVVWDGERDDAFRTRQRLSWHRAAARECGEAGLWFAAAFHLDRLAEADPGDPALRKQRDEARARAARRP